MSFKFEKERRHKECSLQVGHWYSDVCYGVYMIDTTHIVGVVS